MRKTIWLTLCILLALTSRTLAQDPTLPPPPIGAEPVITLIPSPTPIPYPDDEFVTVIVAPHGLLRGTQITAEMLVAVQMPGRVLNDLQNSRTNFASAPHTQLEDAVGKSVLFDVPAFYPIPQRATIDGDVSQRMGNGSMPITIPADQLLMLMANDTEAQIGQRGNLLIETEAAGGVNVVTLVLTDVEFFQIQDDEVVLMARSLRERYLVDALVEGGEELIFAQAMPNLSVDFIVDVITP